MIKEKLFLFLLSGFFLSLFSYAQRMEPTAKLSKSAKISESNSQLSSKANVQNVLPLDPWIQDIIAAHDKLQQSKKDSTTSAEVKAAAEKDLALQKEKLPQKCQFLPADSQASLGSQLLALDNAVVNGVNPQSQSDDCQKLISGFNTQYAKLGTLKNDYASKVALTEQEKKELQDSTVVASQAAAALQALMNTQCNLSSMHVSSVSGKILNTLESSALMLGTAVPTVGLATSAYLLVRDLSSAVIKWAKKNDSGRLRDDVNNDRITLNNLCAYKDIVKLYNKQRLIDESLKDPNLYKQVTDEITKQRATLDKIRCDLKKDPLQELISTNVNLINSMASSSENALNLCIQYFSNFQEPSGLRLQLKKIKDDLNCSGTLNPNSKIGIACLSLNSFFNFAEPSSKEAKPLDGTICIDEQKTSLRDSFVSKIQLVKSSLAPVSADLGSKTAAENRSTIEKINSLSASISELETRKKLIFDNTTGASVKADNYALMSDLQNNVLGEKLDKFVNDEFSEIKKLKNNLAKAQKPSKQNSTSKESIDIKLKDIKDSIEMKLKGIRDICLHFNPPFIEPGSVPGDFSQRCDAWTQKIHDEKI